MKQIVQNYKSGELALLDVPVPACRPGGVLVRSLCSLVSAGTEAMKIGESRLSLVGKARARPDQVKKVVDTVAQQGLVSTYRKVTTRLDSYTPLGYSLSGVVVEVGADIDDLKVGDRVACAGNRYALHAEYNYVPRNLCVPIPEGVSDEHAAFTTVGAIAMQGYRQSEAMLGEIAVVIGLGLVGQLLVQLLRAAGINVVGLDPSESRCELAVRSGVTIATSPADDQITAARDRLRELTEGAGADHVFITAGGDTNQPVEVAVSLARDRARVVDIGKTRLDLPWQDYYEKELDVRFSRSYGPGRYDPAYEEGGADYPIGYVRWTEGRNMASFVDLLAQGRLDMAPLVSSVEPFEDAIGAYERLLAGQLPGVGLLFRYAADVPVERRVEVPRAVASTSVAPGGVRVGVIGAGNYASSMLLPHLAHRSDVSLIEVATASSLSAVNAQRRFGFDRCSTDYRELLADDRINAVIIATRHDLHARMVCEALTAGKTVFVEKPLAVTVEQLDAIVEAVAVSGNDRVMVGFNRRFAPLLGSLRQHWIGDRDAVHVRYNVNAGRLAGDSWYRQQGQGARIVGEGCHFVDTASWWIGADPTQVFAIAAAGDPDDATLTLKYPNGSVATIGYLTRGDARYPKETFTVFGREQVASLQNFRTARHWRGGRRRTLRGHGGIDKGQRAEMAAFVDAVRTGRPMPVAFASLVATTRATFAAVTSLTTGVPEQVVGLGPRTDSR